MIEYEKKTYDSKQVEGNIRTVLADAETKVRADC